MNGVSSTSNIDGVQSALIAGANAFVKSQQIRLGGVHHLSKAMADMARTHLNRSISKLERPEWREVAAGTRWKFRSHMQSNP